MKPANVSARVNRSGIRNWISLIVNEPGTGILGIVIVGEIEIEIARAFEKWYPKNETFHYFQYFQ